jgi:photosystem II stability/assembly factor-like uncharacterized protein
LIPFRILPLVCTLLILPSALFAQRSKPATPGPAAPATAKPASLTAQFAGIGLRGIGPAVTSGRVIAFAVDPADPTLYYVAVASGGVWKTTNSGTSWTPVFDNEGSYSIGAIAMDARNPNVVWVGTGELNAQRSVGYGDGVYKSEDGGKSWKNMGLKTSEHIGRIAIDPTNSDTVYVAAQGPLWSSGGERGLYKTIDGGKTWKQILKISDDTGVTDIVIDPRHPNRIYAAAWQRRRHVFTYIGGGPESGIYRSTDGGATWTRSRSGLPGGDLGRIGLAISPANPDLLYATVEGKEGEGGVYRSTDYAASWEKQGPFLAQGMYYGQIVCDPKDQERLYIPNVILMTSADGGKTVQPVGERDKHVDNHAVWIEPANTRHLLVGCDGGVYESFDRGATWVFKSNMPIAQFYRVATDNAVPFYNVYGGTQDNGSLGGPSRTRSSSGIANDDWYVTLGGDGFQQQVDPADPNIVYSESQDGGLSRLNRRTGETVDIQPLPGKGEPALRWDWDSPVLISPHNHKRLYFAANRLFRSDDQGGSWTPISPDLTRQIDRNKLTIMGKVWPVDAVAKGQSTSFYGNIVALAESPKKEGLIYVGTDDGLIQVTEDGGKTWRKIDTFPGVPAQTYVSYIIASLHDANTVYAAFENHKYGDFAPYILKSADAGRTWTSVAGDLPKNGPVLALAEDHVSPGLLFAGTEFGAYYTVNGGVNWTKLGGLPTIPVRDISIQRRENDLALATFGRGFYILDDYSPLRAAATDLNSKPATLFPPRPALEYTEYSRLGGGKGSQGETYFTAPNPPDGATIAYYLKDSLKTLKQTREEMERDLIGKKQTPPYPTPEQLRAEAEEDASTIILTITDVDGKVVRRLSGPTSSGLHRVTWDLRSAGFFAITEAPAGRVGRRFGGGGGFRVVPGTYRVSLTKRENGALTELAGPITLLVNSEGDEKLSEAERKTLLEMRRKVARLQSAVQGAGDTLDTLLARVAIAREAVQEAPQASPRLRAEAVALEKRLRAIDLELRGDRLTASRNEPTAPSIVTYVNNATFGMLGTSSMPTRTRLESYRIAAELFGATLAKLRAIATADFPRLEKQMDTAGVPYTPGRLPDWKDN